MGALRFMDWGLLISAASAAGLGSVVGSYFTQASERRRARADVLLAVQRLEAARWSVDGDTLYAATRGVEAAALVARVSRDLTVEYCCAAMVAGWEVQELVEEGQNPEVVGINPELSAFVAHASRCLVDAVWRPQVAALVRRRVLKRLRADRETVCSGKPSLERSFTQVRDLLK